MSPNFILLVFFVVILVVVIVVSTMLYRRRPGRRRLAVILGGDFLLGGVAAVIYTSIFLAPGTSSLSDASPVLDTSAGPTPTPIAFINIVVAWQNLPRGYRFPDTLEELQNVVGYYPWPEMAVPFNALTEGGGVLQTLLGKIARTDIVREQPLLWTLVVDDYNDIASLGAVPTVSSLVRGSLGYDEPVAGEINNQNWMEDWQFVGGDGETISFTMEAIGGNLRPFLIVWSDSGEWVDGQRSFDGQTTSLTVTMPHTGYYRVTATRARTNNGSSAGMYRLSAAPGYILAGES